MRSSKRNSLNKPNRKLRSSSNTENTPPASPIDPNIEINSTHTAPVLKEQPASNSQHIQLPLKKDVDVFNCPATVSAIADPHVKVIARIRPSFERTKDWDQMVKKVTPDSISVGDRKFTFDSVFDSNSNQEAFFQSVGVPVVKNALAGYNASVLSYGQSGSGKTYTMWGPPSSIIEDPSPKSHQGIVPRIFQMLFSEIQKEQDKCEDGLINYQCRCSFLEIYNGQIGDLLDPTQRNLEIKDDPKNGLHVENLTEEYVTSYDDVTQILIKGLSSRKVGATSINSKSSRSHIVFTCTIESWSKVTSNCFSSSRTSRISLIDLAGTDRNKIEDANRISLKEGKYVKKSLAQLGYLTNILAKETPSQKSLAVPYSSYCLTHLLQESLGGNAKLTVICAISPDNKNSGETLSTIRFGQRVKLIGNNPVINEITEEDVNDLSDQIRQLKEELIKAKSYECNFNGNTSGYFQGKNVRDSLNQLRVSLNHSLLLRRVDSESEEDLDVDAVDVMELHQHLDKLRRSIEENIEDQSGNKESSETEMVSENGIICQEGTEISVDHCGEIDSESGETAEKCESVPYSGFAGAVSSKGIYINTIHQNLNLDEPPLSESPRIGNIITKSMASPSRLCGGQSISESSNFMPDASGQSLKSTEVIRSSLQSTKVPSSPTESLAASFRRGLQIIESHQQNSLSKKSSVSFSFEQLTLKPSPEADASFQKLSEESPSLHGSPSLFTCASCQQRSLVSDSKCAPVSLKTWTAEINESGNSSQVKDQDGKDSAVEDINRKDDLEKLCMEQAAKIEQLNQLVEQYKQERECSSLVEIGQENNTLCLEGSKNQIVPETIKEKCEIKEVREEFNCENKNAFDMTEKEAVVKEIQYLRSKLQSCTDAPVNRSTEKLRSSLLSRSIQLRKSIVEIGDDNKEEFEKERQRWMEMESDWISLTDELRLDLESQRQLAEKVEMELRLEKKCTEELNDALQRSILGHVRFVEQYTELQEKYNDLAARNRTMTEWIGEVKKAVVKAKSKGGCSRFSKSLAAELSALRVEKERERELLRKENRSLKIQLRDTAEAVHAAGELLVRLREAEHSTAVAEEKMTNIQEENEKLRKQVEKIKRKHRMEVITMKQYMAESRLPESALKPMYGEDLAETEKNSSTFLGDDQAWRTEFGAIYQEHY